MKDNPIPSPTVKNAVRNEIRIPGIKAINIWIYNVFINIHLFFVFFITISISNSSPFKCYRLLGAIL